MPAALVVVLLLEDEEAVAAAPGGQVVGVVAPVEQVVEQLLTAEQAEVVAPEEPQVQPAQGQAEVEDVEAVEQPLAFGKAEFAGPERGLSQEVEQQV